MTYARWRVYTHCRHGVLSFHEPRSVKIWAVADTLHMRRSAVIASLNWLIHADYLTAHGRDEHNTRRLTLTYARRFPTGTTSAA